MSFKNTVTFFVFSLIVSITNGQGIEFFHGSWDEVLGKANKEQKPIFIDAYTTWCGPCKRMAKNTFTKKEVGDFFNKNFINVKYDMEKEDGVKFGHQYPVSAYPTLYFINEKGEVLKKVVGGQNPASLITKAKEALKANDKSGDFEKAYNEGNRDFDLVFNYIKALNDVDKPSLKISNEFLNSSPEITNEQRLKFILEAGTEADSKIFEEVIAKKDEIIKLVGKDTYMEKAQKACQKTYTKSIEYEYQDLMNEAISKAHLTLSDSLAYTFEYRNKMDFYQSFNQKDDFWDTAKSYVGKMGKKDPIVLSYAANQTCKTLSDNPKAVKKALKWAKKAHKMDDSAMHFQSYCYALITAKDYDKCLSIVEEQLGAEQPKYNKSVLMQIKMAATKAKDIDG